MGYLREYYQILQSHPQFFKLTHYRIPGKLEKRQSAMRSPAAGQAAKESEQKAAPMMLERARNWWGLID
jgi:hypothetical protein